MFSGSSPPVIYEAQAFCGTETDGQSGELATKHKVSTDCGKTISHLRIRRAPAIAISTEPSVSELH